MTAEQKVQKRIGTSVLVKADLIDTEKIIIDGLSGTTGAGAEAHITSHHPEIANNPIHHFAPALQALTEEVWDQGNQFFPPTSLQVSNINSGTGAENIIPGELELQFNLRFCTELDEATIKQRVHAIFGRFDFDYIISWRLSGN